MTGIYKWGLTVVARRKFQRAKWEVREALDLWVYDFPITKLFTTNLDIYELSRYQVFVVFLSVSRLRPGKRLERISGGKSVPVISEVIMNTGGEI